MKKVTLPMVSVVIVNYNGKEVLDDCFSSLLQVNYPQNKLEIFMVDNGSTDGSVEYAGTKFPKVKILANSENNYAKANNLGIKSAKGEYVALVNNDVIFDKDWLAALIDTARKNPKAGALGSKILFMDGSVQSVGHQEYPNFYWGDIGFGDKDPSKYNTVKEIVSICGCSVLYRKKCIDDVGLLDEDFIMFMEDVDMGIRCRKKGWKLLSCPASVIHHKFHKTINSEERARYWQETNRLVLIAKHWPEKLAAALAGKDFFTIKENFYTPRDISEVIGKVLNKLLKEHGTEKMSKLSPDLFEAVRKIYDFEKDYLLQSGRNELEEKNKALEALETLKQENARLIQGLPLLQQEKEQDLSAKEKELSLKEQELSNKDKELSLKDQEVAALKETVALATDKLKEELAHKEAELIQKNEEVMRSTQEIDSLKKEIEVSQQKQAQELLSLQEERHQEINYLNEQNEQAINALNQQKAQELSVKEKELSLKEQEFSNKDKELSLKDQEIATLREATASEAKKHQEEVSVLQQGHKETLSLLREEIATLKQGRAEEFQSLQQKHKDSLLSLREEVAALKQSRAEEFQSLQQKHKDSLLSLREEVAALKQSRKDDLLSLEQRHKEAIALIQTQKEEELASLKQGRKEELLSLQQKHKETIASIREEMTAMKQGRKEELLSLQQRHKEAIASIKQEKERELKAVSMEKEKTLALKTKELMALKKEIQVAQQKHKEELQLLLQRKEESFNSFRLLTTQELANKDKALSFLDREVAELKETVASDAKKQREELLVLEQGHKQAIASIQMQKDTELSDLSVEKERQLALKAREYILQAHELALKTEESVRIKQKIEDLQKKHEEELFSARQQKEQEVTYLKEQYESEAVALRLQSQQARNELQAVYNSTVYRRFIRPLWDLLWPMKQRIFVAKHKITRLVTESREIIKARKARIIVLTSMVITKFNELYYRSLHGNGIGSTYLNHIKFNTFPMVPQKFTLMINRVCNLKCKFCDIAEVPNRSHVLSREDACKIIYSARKLGAKEMVITGGEPFIHPDIFEIIDFAHAVNLDVVITTNGMYIKKNIKKILQSHIQCVCVSIDGKEGTHDSLRNHEGAYKEAMEGIQLLKENHFNVSVNFVVTSKNVFELEEVYNFFAKMGIPVFFLPVINKPELFPARPREREVYLKFIQKLRAQRSISHYDFTYLKNAIENYFSKPEVRVRCLGLNREFGIDTDGNISPCCVWENKKPELNSLGNVIQDDLEKLWYSAAFRDARASILNEGCVKCFNPSIVDLPKLAHVPFVVPPKHKKGLLSVIPREREPILLLPKPNHMHFRFTNRCNLTCRHCDIWKQKHNPAKEISVEQWKCCADKLHAWLGNFLLDLAGGEILLYPGATEIIQHCAKKGITVNLTTNSTLIDEATAKRLVEAGINCVNLSLDGLADVHAYTRNNDAAFEKVRLAAANLAKCRTQPPPYLCISIVITRLNLKQLPELIKLPKEWGINNISLQALDHNFGAPYTERWFENNQFWPQDYAEVEDVIEGLKEAKKSGVAIYNSIDHLNAIKAYYKDPIEATRHECLSGFNNFIVNESGEALLCWNMPAVGDLLKEDPEKIWNSSAANKMRRQIERCRRTCRMLNCNYV